MGEQSSDYTYELHRGAEAMEQVDWEQIHALARSVVLDAYLNSPHNRWRSREEVETYVGWPDTERFARSRYDPQSEVGVPDWPDDGKLFKSNQEYRNPRLAIASADGKIIGFASGADNVSGETEAERSAKRRSVVKNYFWLREVMVGSAHQRQGIGTHLGRMMLKGLFPARPVSTYIYPDELPVPQLPLSHAGFTPSHSENVFGYPFGRDRKPARVVQMKSRTVLEARTKSRLHW